LTTILANFYAAVAALTKWRPQPLDECISCAAAFVLISAIFETALEIQNWSFATTIDMKNGKQKGRKLQNTY
jgi:hypothetical protein